MPEDLSCGVRLLSICLSPLAANQTGLTGNFWSKSRPIKIAKIRTPFLYEDFKKISVL